LGEAVPSSLIVQGRNVIVTDVVERAVAERPDLPHELFTPFV
jgi:hypothetical protein